jgi:DNA helicase HerA-like ATPase
MDPELKGDDELVGFVAGGSGASWCYVLLVEGKEDVVMEESLAYVLDRGQKVLGVLRSGRGLDENLRIGTYTPGVAYARKGFTPSSSRRSFTYIFSVIGRVEGGRIKENRLILTPGSQVLLCSVNPFEELEGGYIYAARHWEKPWKIPFDPKGIPMHVGVVGSTGSGKSFLTRHVIIPLMNEAGYSALVFDWHGCDYAPFVGEDQKVSISDVELDGAAVARYLAEKASYFGYRDFENEACRCLQDALESSDEWRSLNLEGFVGWLEEQIGDKDKRLERTWLRIQRGLGKLGDDDWKRVQGRVKPSDVLEKAREKRLLVVDMSGVGDAEKLSAFCSVAEAAKRRVDAGEDMNLCIVVDEAPQFCPFRAEGIQLRSKDLIRDLTATGRKHKLSFVLISQGLAGEIGVDASVRRNLNTHFIGRIMPQDRREVEDMLGAYHVSYESLLRLEPGQFYFEGRMNPFPTPLLISFDV